MATKNKDNRKFPIGSKVVARLIMQGPDGKFHARFLPATIVEVTRRKNKEDGWPGGGGYSVYTVRLESGEKHSPLRSWDLFKSMEEAVATRLMEDESEVKMARMLPKTKVLKMKWSLTKSLSGVEEEACNNIAKQIEEDMKKRGSKWRVKPGDVLDSIRNSKLATRRSSL